MTGMRDTAGEKDSLTSGQTENHDADLARGALAITAIVCVGHLVRMIFHADQSSEEYTADASRATCLGLPFPADGRASDNATIRGGAWHPTLEFELRSADHFPGKVAAKTRVLAWVDDCSGHRRHLALQMSHPWTMSTRRRTNAVT